MLDESKLGCGVGIDKTGEVRVFLEMGDECGSMDLNNARTLIERLRYYVARGEEMAAAMSAKGVAKA